MPGESADCIVTSPPYWAKRDYRVVGQYGHEPDPAGYIETMRSVFHEARRVLANDGTCWLNLGDSYSSGSMSSTGLHAYLGHGLTGRHAPGMGTKNLLGLPWRVALALQSDGWILRNAIIWHKPNAMPESVRDRMSCRYEQIFLLVKSRHYWFDLDPIRIPHATIRRTDTRRPPTKPTGRRRPGSSRPPKYSPYAPRDRRRAAVRRLAAAAQPTPRAATPAMSGPSPPVPIWDRISPRSRSTFRPGASRRAASPPAWCSTCSAAPEPPVSPPSPSADGSPASNSARRSPPSPPNDSTRPPNRAPVPNRDRSPTVIVYVYVSRASARKGAETSRRRRHRRSRNVTSEREEPTTTHASHHPRR